MNLRTTLYAAAACALLAACDDDTASLGIYAETDDVLSTAQTFSATSTSVALGNIVANSTKSYLGLVEDSETDTEIRAEFMTQFHTFEDYSLPDAGLIKKDAAGNIVADSVEVRLYFTNYFGDDDNPMKVSVYELDRDNPLREDWTYYSATDIADYIPAGTQPLAQKVFTVSDYTLTDVERTSSSHYKNVRIMLPADFGQEILNKAATHPEYFADSWQFMHHVCPGFAFRLESGRGTMLELDVSALNIYFGYGTAANPDTTIVGIARFAATPEVIQTTSIRNSGIDALLAQTSKPYTFVKSPAGVATEITLPVDEIFEGHTTDSISRARLTLARYNSSQQTDYTLDAPATLLMVMQDSLEAFFDKRKVADDKTSYTAPLTSAYNVYTFSNISRMIAYMHHAKLTGMAAENLTSEQWNAAHPSWNKVVVTPVVIKTVTNQTTSITSQVSVTHDFSLSSTRLVGGTQPIDLHIIYSSY